MKASSDTAAASGADVIVPLSGLRSCDVALRLDFVGQGGAVFSRLGCE